MATTNDAAKSKNQLLIEVFMSKMRSDLQHVPTAPTMPSLEVRKLRAALMLEEVLETINEGLGLSAVLEGGHKWSFTERSPGSLIEIADGCADVEVVTTGTASACGIAMQPVFELVMGNNLLKFAPGHYFREDGKLVKPKDHPAVTELIRGQLVAQGLI